jgi:predicted AAA+ superfamily ATPase
LDNLNFWRTQDKKEIDFILKTDIINQAIEVKYSNQKVNFEVFLNNYKDFKTKIISKENVFEII